MVTPGLTWEACTNSLCLLWTNKTTMRTRRHLPKLALMGGSGGMLPFRDQKLPDVDGRTVGFAFEDLRGAELGGAAGQLQLGVGGGGHASQAKV